MSLEKDLDPATPPEFVKLKEGATDTNLAESWDWWVVTRSGDHKTDYMKGVEYGDTAIRKCIATNNPGCVTMPLMQMAHKCNTTDVGDGAVEKGFLDRVVSLAAERRVQLDAN